LDDPCPKETHLENADKNRFNALIGGRIRLFRESLGYTQGKLASEAKGTKRAFQDNEMGKTAPNSKALHGLLQLGMNLNWLLSGEGPMLLSEVEKQKYTPNTLDQGLLVFVVDAINKAVKDSGRTITTEKYAEAAAIFYDFCQATNRRDSSMVERLIDLAANQKVRT
jgi:transcriptional regulator with XRE-family HTH domain